jgi:hypothetical protein
MIILDDEVNLLTLWPATLAINGKHWPFLKVVFLMVNKHWPRGPVYYPFEPCDPSKLSEGVRPALLG